MKTTSNGRRPQILKVEYLSNYWSDILQILNLDLCDQNKLYKCFKWKQPQMEDDLKFETEAYMIKPRQPPMEDDLKY